MWNPISARTPYALAPFRSSQPAAQRVLQDLGLVPRADPQQQLAGFVAAAMVIAQWMQQLQAMQALSMRLAQAAPPQAREARGGPSGAWREQRAVAKWGQRDAGAATAAEIRRIPSYHQLAPSLQRAAVDAVRMGLTVTSTTGGTHSPTSFHYRHNHADGRGHAIDVAGDPAKMAAFYRRYVNRGPRELFYDPLGGVKNGVQIGPIGGHWDHVHLALD